MLLSRSGLCDDEDERGDERCDDGDCGDDRGDDEGGRERDMPPLCSGDRGDNRPANAGGDDGVFGEQSELKSGETKVPSSSTASNSSSTSRSSLVAVYHACVPLRSLGSLSPRERILVSCSFSRVRRTTSSSCGFIGDVGDDGEVGRGGEVGGEVGGDEDGEVVDAVGAVERLEESRSGGGGAEARCFGGGYRGGMEIFDSASASARVSRTAAEANGDEVLEEVLCEECSFDLGKGSVDDIDGVWLEERELDRIRRCGCWPWWRLRCPCGRCRRGCTNSIAS